MIDLLQSRAAKTEARQECGAITGRVRWLQVGDGGEYAGQVPHVAAAALECVALYTGIAASQRRRIVCHNGR